MEGEGEADQGEGGEEKEPPQKLDMSIAAIYEAEASVNLRIERHRPSARGTAHSCGAVASVLRRRPHETMGSVPHRRSGPTRGR